MEWRIYALPGGIFPQGLSFCVFCGVALDILAGEKTDLRLRQDGWYRFASGWLDGKDCCFVEDPNEYIRGINEDIKNGINDRFILFVMEPFAHGFHVAFPYGSWLQNQVKDAFWPDLRLLRKLGPWLDEKEALFGKEHAARVAVVYDSASAYENSVSEPATGGTMTYNKVEKISLDGVEELGKQGAFSNQGNFGHFFRLIQDLSDRHVLYNVLFESKDEPLTAERLKPYRTVVVPDAFLLDGQTAAVLQEFAREGGTVLTLERAAAGLKQFCNYTENERETLIERLEQDDDLLTAPESPFYGVDLRKTEKGYALHLVNYRYNEETHRIDDLDDLTFRLGFPVSSVKVHSFPENPRVQASVEKGELTVKHAGIYTVLEME